MRLSRQWGHLKKKIKFGLVHSRGNAGPGDLEFFCPTCPQPGVNLPADWAQDANDWKYQRVFVVDGNFSAEHMRARGNSQDIHLTKEAGYSTALDEFNQHLSTTKDTQLVSVAAFCCLSWMNLVEFYLQWAPCRQRYPWFSSPSWYYWTWGHCLRQAWLLRANKHHRFSEGWKTDEHGLRSLKSPQSNERYPLSGSPVWHCLPVQHQLPPPYISKSISDFATKFKNHMGYWAIPHSRPSGCLHTEVLTELHSWCWPGGWQNSGNIVVLIEWSQWQHQVNDNGPLAGGIEWPYVGQ